MVSEMNLCVWNKFARLSWFIPGLFQVLHIIIESPGFCVDKCHVYMCTVYIVSDALY